MVIGRLNKKRLTIGVISKDGMPFVEWMLNSLLNNIEPLLEAFGAIEFILVDSESTDSTLEIMSTFRKCQRPSVAVKIYLLQGYCSASIARNVILEKSTSDYLFLCDGDIDINLDFLIAAIDEMENGKADAVVGQLSEEWYDKNYLVYNTVNDRTKIEKRGFIRISGGLIVVSRPVVLSGLRYDESLRRGEDRDFSLRLTESFHLLAIPVSMGVHMTHPYLSDERYATFSHEKYARPVGRLLRKHIKSPKNIIEIFSVEKGSMLGISYYFLSQRWLLFGQFFRYFFGGC